VVYLLLFVVLAAACGAQHRVTTRHAASVIAAAMLATFAAWRGPDVAADFPVYETWYTYRGQDTGFLERSAFLEAIYFLANDLFASAGVPFRGFLWMLAFLAVYLKFRVILSYCRQRTAVVVAVMVYCSTFYLLHEFTQVRAGLAIAVMFLGIRPLLAGDRIGFLLHLVLALGFHSSALIFLVLLLPLSGRVSRMIDVALTALVCVLFAFALRGIAPGTVLMELLAGFDARVALYVSFAEKAHAEAANPLSVPALLLFALAMSLVGVEHRRSRPPRPGAEVSEARLAHEASARRVLHLVRRGLLFGLVFLIAFAPIKEVALRLFEIFAALLPLLAAVLFSMRRHHASKLLLIGWAAATGFIYMLREEGLVKSYVVYFTF
jgi:hypothetical protein